MMLYKPATESSQESSNPCEEQDSYQAYKKKLEEALDKVMDKGGFIPFTAQEPYYQHTYTSMTHSYPKISISSSKPIFYKIPSSWTSMNYGSNSNTNSKKD